MSNGSVVSETLWLRRFIGSVVAPEYWDCGCARALAMWLRGLRCVSVLVDVVRVKGASRPCGLEQVRPLTRTTSTREGRSYADPAPRCELLSGDSVGPAGSAERSAAPPGRSAGAREADAGSGGPIAAYWELLGEQSATGRPVSGPLPGLSADSGLLGAIGRTTHYRAARSPAVPLGGAPGPLGGTSAALPAVRRAEVAGWRRFIGTSDTLSGP
jgi:hypothetical protein